MKKLSSLTRDRRQSERRGIAFLRIMKKAGWDDLPFRLGARKVNCRRGQLGDAKNYRRHHHPH